ncbi:Nucleolar protein 9 [Arthrobotrys musiformis]|uniref:Nucleolar protein 9 n=1 Tax=Arthrobotrys musiformis TaxID=47236 RepID=A0AAV9WAN4_9PEZI
MPKELKKRGRREAKRQKLDHDTNGHEVASSSSASKPVQGLALATQAFVSGESDATGNDQLPFESSIAPGATFFGLLDEQEQEYFRKADDTLEANLFKSEEERDMFLQNVLKETENKELKMACSQGCSRLLEKLLFLANPDRVKVVFQKFHGHFGHLMEHRFASHCCEALFTAAASIAAAEYTGLSGGSTIGDDKDTFVSAESLFLYTVTELEPLIDGLLMNPFGAHVLRTLFLVLSGAPLDSQSHKSIMHSKRKENVSAALKKTDGSEGQARPVPESFREALSKIINTITGDINRESIRNLATDPLGSPTLQLLIELDLGRSRKHKTKIEDSLVGKLLLQLPEDEERDTDATRSFVKMLLSDTVGSHLLERVMMCVPKKTFNQLYSQYFKDGLGNLAASEIASYVVIKVLDKLETPEFKAAEEELKKALPSLLENHRVAVIRSVVENCSKRGLSADGFCDSLFKTWGSGSGEEQDLLLKILEIKPGEVEDGEGESDGSKETQKKNPGQLHASLLVQALLSVPGECSRRVKESILSCPDGSLRQLCKHHTASHAIQKSIDSDPTDIAYKRKFVGLLSGSIADLAVHPVGSHVIDTLFKATLSGLKLQRQRIADELLASERRLRDSLHGRAVWRNWKMDMYKTRRYDWNNITAASISNEAQPEAAEVKKSAIQIASERHAAAKKAKEEKEKEKEKGKLKEKEKVASQPKKRKQTT